MFWRVSSARSSIRKAPGWAQGWEPARGWARGCKVGIDGNNKTAGRRAAVRRFVFPEISIIVAERDPERPRLVRQISYPRTQSALAVQRQKCPLVPPVVDAHPCVPARPR